MATDVKVQEWWHDANGEMWLSQWCFDSEREGRAWINVFADGTKTYSLYVNGELIVESRFPVLMVA